MQDEPVWKLRLDSKLSEGLGREMSVVRSDDYVGMCVNRSCQDVPVVGIWKMQSLNQPFKAGHERIGCVKVHQVSRSSFGAISRDDGATALESTPHVRGRPLRAKEASQGEVHE